MMITTPPDLGSYFSSKQIMRVLLIVLIILNILHPVVELLRGSSVDPILEPTLNPLMDLYTGYCRKSLPTHTIKVAPVKSKDPGVIAECQSGLYRKTIRIDPKFFQVASEQHKLTVLAHEFSHCFLGLDHVEKEDHYMYPMPSRKIEHMELKWQFGADLLRECNK